MTLSDDITSIKGVGGKYAKLYGKVGVKTVDDLLTYYPRRYDDYSNVQTVRQIRPGQITLKVQIKQVKSRYGRAGLHITEAVASDKTGSVKVVWFNQPYRATGLRANELYYLSGLFEYRYNRLSIINPAVELVSAFPINTARIVPVYRETKGLTSRQIRNNLKTILSLPSLVPDTLPEDIVADQKLISRYRALKLKHFPTNLADLSRADERLGFEELFELILASQYIRRELNKFGGCKIKFDLALARKFVKHLPFELTDAQKKAVWQAYLDMDSGRVMNRLVEGDVGSGKTVVAVMIAVMVIASGYQVAFLAPTELLALQHAQTIKSLLEPLGFAGEIALLVGAQTSKQKQQLRQDIATHQKSFIIGTHTLLQDNVDIQKLALVIVDEQHRFGVAQRQKLLSKVGHMPHMLSLTATPIPRSLALTIFGELEISLLKHKPSNRLPIISKLVNPTDRDKVYQHISSQINEGRQIFVVCPLIEESDKLQAKSVDATYKEIKKAFSKHRVGLLHGKLKTEEKQYTMEQFLAKEIDILVSTTVIEVGVDVPNATVMMIEAPERFGLAQLHQLRGRVGRSSHQGFCYFMLSDSMSVSRRLRAIESTSDGFKLAELDLQIRGAGALYGTSQHGQLDLKIADFTDSMLIARAQKSAKKFMTNAQNLIKYPCIYQKIQELQSVVHLN